MNPRIPDQAEQLNETLPPEQQKKFSMVPSLYGCITRASLDVQGAYAHVVIKQYIWKVNDIQKETNKVKL